MIRLADQIHEGDTIHVVPHEVWRGSDTAWPTHTDAIVVVTGVCPVSGIVVVLWRGDGEERGSVVYDRDDAIEVIEAAA